MLLVIFIILLISLYFRENVAQKVGIFDNFFQMRPRDPFGLATPGLYSMQKKLLYQAIFHKYMCIYVVIHHVKLIIP
jgi:hypothetical protein